MPTHGPLTRCVNLLKLSSALRAHCTRNPFQGVAHMAEGVKRTTSDDVQNLDHQLPVRHSADQAALAERAARILTKREGRRVRSSEVFRRGMVQFAQRIVRTEQGNGGVR